MKMWFVWLILTQQIAMMLTLSAEQNFKKYILRFILPCKSACYPIFGITQFVTQFTHVLRHFEAKSRKQTNKFRKNSFDNMLSNFWKNIINCL